MDNLKGGEEEIERKEKIQSQQMEAKLAETDQTGKFLGRH